MGVFRFSGARLNFHRAQSTFAARDGEVLLRQYGSFDRTLLLSMESKNREQRQESGEHDRQPNGNQFRALHNRLLAVRKRCLGWKFRTTERPREVSLTL